MIEFAAEAEGLAVTDVVEHTHYRVETGPIDPAPASADLLPAPVDDAVRFRTDELRLPTVVDCYLRRPDGELLDATTGGRRTLAEPVVVETTTAPMKLYLRLGPPATVETGEHETVLRFDAPSEVVVGARSAHRHPAGTITTPTDPASLARAVSLFGSALKTTSPERSFPTLRGHPPLLVPGDSFDAGGVEAPDTGVRLAVPADLESIFTVTPLAYYLGAEVVTTDRPPRLTAAGEPFPLHGDLRGRVAELLRHVFLLDCITRTEGLYRVDLHEREQAAERVDLAPAEWYDLPIDERTAAYLSVPREPLAELLDWHLTADVEPAARNAEMLPYLANDMALIRSPTAATRNDGAVSEPAELTDFFRTERTPGRRTRATQNADSDGNIISPVDADTYGHVWVGEEFPMGAAKPTVDAYRRRLDRQPADTESIQVTLVCNDEEMVAEAAGGLYGFFDMLSFDVETHRNLTQAELREVLQGDVDFLHYVGHVEDRGVQCADGWLDLETLDGTGVDAFLLNGCQSYEQGQALVDAGALGGIVTLTTVANQVATETGRNLAHLLDVGFDFHGALDVVRQTSLSLQNYVVVGDGGVTISQSDSGTPYLYRLERLGEETITVTAFSYPTRNFGLGTMTRPYVSDTGLRHIASESVGTYRVCREKFDGVLGSERVPILLDSELHWTNSIDLDEVRN